MPVYEIENLKTGQKLRIEGKVPPSPADVDHIFSQQQPTTMDKIKQSAIQNLAGMAFGPRAESMVSQYPQEAQQAVSETLSQPIPYLGAGVEALRNKIPQQMAERGGIPGAAAGAILGTAGEALPKTGGDLALQGLTGPVLEGVGIAGKAIGRKVLPKISETLTQIEAPFVERAIQRASQIGNKFESVLNSDIGEMAVGKLKDAVKAARLAARQKLEMAEDALASRVVNKVPITDLGEELAKKLGNAGFKVKGYVGSEVTDQLSKKTGEILNDFRKPEALSFKGALSLKRKIDRVIDFLKPGEMTVSGAEEGILKDIRFKLKDRLLKADPTFAKANNAFAKMAAVYDQLRDDVFSGKPEVVYKRIAKMMKNGTVERKAVEKIDQMGGEASGTLDDILDTITASKFSPRLHPSIGKAALGTGGGIVGLAAKGHFKTPEELAITAAGALAGGTLTSPRFNFRVLQAAKTISKELSKLGLGTKISASVLAPWIHRQIVEKTMDDHLNAPSSNP